MSSCQQLNWLEPKVNVVTPEAEVDAEELDTAEQEMYERFITVLKREPYRLAG